MRKTWKRWTATETELCFALYRANRPLEEIAAAVGHSATAVRLYCVKHGVFRENARRQRWLSAFRQPHSTRELAERFGVRPSSVLRAKSKLRRQGYRMRKSFRTVAFRPEMLCSAEPYPDHTRPARCPCGRPEDECPACERAARKEGCR